MLIKHHFFVCNEIKNVKLTLHLGGTPQGTF